VTATPVPYEPVVYRVYDKSGRLIYVGASCRLENRLNNHRTISWWYGLMDRVETEPHPTREAAMAAEAEVIRTEQPAFNSHHIGPRKGELTDDDVRVCREWASHKDWARAGFLPMRLRWVADR
jgi:predicted GIY-YIG superfamily endonuclease